MQFNKDYGMNPNENDSSPWSYRNKTARTFVYQGWLNDVGFVDGHIPANTSKEAIALLSKMGTFKWISMTFICTKFNPWTPEISTFASHEGECVGESYDGTIDNYVCKNCKTNFSVGHY